MAYRFTDFCQFACECSTLKKFIPNVSSSPMLRDIIINPIKMSSEGMMEVPQTPGLGILIDEKAIKKYRVN